MDQANPNWKEVIDYICEHCTQTELAKKVGVEQQHISRAKKTDNINYRLGYALMVEYNRLQLKYLHKLPF